MSRIVAERDRVFGRLAESAERLGDPPDAAAALDRKRRMGLVRGDFQTDPHSTIRPDLRPAAVLVPLVDHDDGLRLLLTQRADHLSSHAGQISFPGGRIEEQDAGFVDAALRETEEEIGLPRHRIEVVGRLDDYVTGTGFLIAPVVGVIRPPYPLDPDPLEVADVFEVPLDFLLDPRNHLRHSRVFNGLERHFYAMPYEERYIWGATAAMIVNLYEVLAGE